MNAHVLHAINDLRYEDVEIPTVKDNEVLVNVKACGICGSDINRVFKTGTYHFPTVIGHEFSGIVINDDRWPEWSNKRVGIFPLKPCFKCDNCVNGDFELCRNYDYLGSRCDGGFEEYVSVPKWNLIELPDNVSFEQAAMLEPASVAMHALNRIRDIKDSSIAILGPGSIGNIIMRLAKIKGASSVTMLGRSQKQLDFASSFGADKVININDDIESRVNEITYGRGFNIVIEGIGINSSLSTAINIVKSGGEIVLLANPQDDVILSKEIYWKILRKQLVISGTWNSSFGDKKNDWKQVLGLLESGCLDLTPIISHKLEFRSLYKGLEIMNNKNIFSNKVMLYNNG